MVSTDSATNSTFEERRRQFGFGDQGRRRNRRGVEGQSALYSNRTGCVIVLPSTPHYPWKSCAGMNACQNRSRTRTARTDGVLYSSKIIKAGALLADTKTLLAHWDESQPVADNLAASALTACVPGMLKGSGDVPATQTPEGYPVRIDWDGILTDDPEHVDDVVRRVDDGLEFVWEDQAETVERQACDMLGVKALRDYFRKPGNGGFWADHVSRYSKSRRKAPIYWLLQSAKKNYSLWLYYHRLDKDILFKALVNYVDPKIRLEESRLASQRSQKGTGSSKKLDKEIEKQEDFLSELRDFEDKLRRAANLHLEPDLNDGVVLNIAPLWELVPWKEAKAYWEELMDGKYEWSSIGKQLRQKGLVRC